MAGAEKVKTNELTNERKWKYILASTYIDWRVKPVKSYMGERKTPHQSPGRRADVASKASQTGWP